MSSQQLVINEKRGKLKYVNIQSSENRLHFVQNQLSVALHSLGCHFPEFVSPCARFANVWSSRFHSGTDSLVTRGFSRESGVWINSRNGWAPTGISIFEAQNQLNWRNRRLSKSFSLYLKIKENFASLPPFVPICVFTREKRLSTSEFLFIVDAIFYETEFVLHKLLKSPWSCSRCWRKRSRKTVALKCSFDGTRQSVGFGVDIPLKPFGKSFSFWFPLKWSEEQWKIPWLVEKLS